MTDAAEQGMILRRRRCSVLFVARGRDHLDEASRGMELHQIRYFLALSDLLNFTAAAEACNVSQPALSRAIAQLEAELGGTLFRRERKFTHLTDFGRAVLPALRDCYQSNLSVKALARDFHQNGHAPLHLALSHAVDIEVLSPFLAEVGRAFPRLEISVFRGSSGEISARLRSGEVEVAIAGELADRWDRIDARRLFEQRFGLLVRRSHALARRGAVELRDLAGESLLGCPGCPIAEALRARLEQEGVTQILRHEVTTMEDIPALVSAGVGIGLWPGDRAHDDDLTMIDIDGHPMTRWIEVYTVFGRQLSAAAKTLVHLLASAGLSGGRAAAVGSAASPSLADELDARTQRCKDMDAPLATRLEELAADVRRLSPQFADVVERMVRRLRESGAGETAPQVGAPMVPFVLPDEGGRLRSLQEFLGTGPAVIAFHRGHWCPYCRIEARALAQVEPEVERIGGRIVLITPETRDYTRKMKAEAGGRFPILSDLDNGYALGLDLAIRINDEKRDAMVAVGWDISAFHSNDDWILPIPAAFVVDGSGIVRGRFVDPDYRRRIDIEGLLDAVRHARATVPPGPPSTLGVGSAA